MILRPGLPRDEGKRAVARSPWAFLLHAFLNGSSTFRRTHPCGLLLTTGAGDAESRGLKRGNDPSSSSRINLPKDRINAAAKISEFKKEQRDDEGRLLYPEKSGDSPVGNAGNPHTEGQGAWMLVPNRDAPRAWMLAILAVATFPLLAGASFRSANFAVEAPTREKSPNAWPSAPRLAGPGSPKHGSGTTFRTGPRPALFESN